MGKLAVGYKYSIATHAVAQQPFVAAYAFPRQDSAGAFCFTYRRRSLALEQFAGAHIVAIGAVQHGVLQVRAYVVAISKRDETTHEGSDCIVLKLDAPYVGTRPETLVEKLDVALELYSRLRGDNITQLCEPLLNAVEREIARADAILRSKNVAIGKVGI